MLGAFRSHLSPNIALFVRPLRLHCSYTFRSIITLSLSLSLSSFLSLSLFFNFLSNYPSIICLYMFVSLCIHKSISFLSTSIPHLPMLFSRASRVPTIFLLSLLTCFADAYNDFSLYRRQIRFLVERVNEASEPFIGVVMAFQTEAATLENSGEFVSRTDLPWIDLYGSFLHFFKIFLILSLSIYPSISLSISLSSSGRRFHVGSIRKVPVIWVMSGERRVKQKELEDSLSLSLSNEEKTS